MIAMRRKRLPMLLAAASFAADESALSVGRGIEWFRGAFNP